jgi:D-3-phosphoglycerate dehydrogenase
MRILITDGMDKSAIAQLKDHGHEIVEQFYSPEELGAALRDFDAVVIRSATKIRKAQLEIAKDSRLKLIIRGGVGVDNIDVADAEAMGITVRNTPNASSNAVAELAIGMMFSCARNIAIASHTMREHKWEKKAYGKGFELCGKTLGVIGYGRIGKRIGDIAQAIGMNVIAYQRHPKPEYECETMRFASLEELLAQSDVIALSTPSLGEPIISAENIGKMKDGVVIINTSRGANVDEDALLTALNSGKVRAAGLDVWAEEPTRNAALYTHPAVSCTPHIGAATVEAQKRIGSEIVAIVEGFHG